MDYFYLVPAELVDNYNMVYLDEGESYLYEYGAEEYMEEYLSYSRKSDYLEELFAITVPMEFSTTDDIIECLEAVREKCSPYFDDTEYDEEE